MNPWDRRFMCLAKTVASWSKDPSSKIGVVLIRDKKIVSTGYNGFPPGIADDERLDDREKKYPLVVHGEMNAILQAGSEARGATMYLYSPFGGYPCSNCGKHTIAAGIVEVVALPIKENARWNADCQLSQEMLSEAGVLCRIMEDIDD